MSVDLFPTQGSGRDVRLADVKSPSAFRTISEVAADLNLPQHVLRFWETKFEQIKPVKRGGGRRYYRPEDIQLINGIKDMLYNQGFTIRGVQKHLSEQPRTIKRVSQQHNQGAAVAELSDILTSMNTECSGASYTLSPGKRKEIIGVLDELKALREMIRLSGI